jgi:hypothetical protein
MKKILGILLGVCFLMSVTAATVCADANSVNNYKPGPVNNYKPGPVNNYKPGPVNNYKPGKKPFFKQTTHKKMHKAGYWGYETFWHNKDKNHKSRWFTKERHYFPGYDYYI